MSKRKTLRTAGIVLDTTKLAEQDLILTLLCKDGCQRRAVAKGARKPGSRMAARAELFCEDDLLLSYGRGSLAIISEAQTTEAHASLRGDLGRLSAASAVSEVARLSSLEDMEDPYLYPICSRALAACEQASDSAHQLLVVATYIFKVLAHSGWYPELSCCVACGDADVTWFSATAGGLLCASCARDVKGAVEVSLDDLAWLRALIALTFDQLMDTSLEAREAQLLLELAHLWAQTQLNAALRAVEFVRGV